MNYSNTNEKLYEDIALREKTDGRDLFAQIPLAPDVKNAPTVLDFGYGFGENLFALSNAYPNGKIYGIDCSPVCQKVVGKKVAARGIKNITLINWEKCHTLYYIKKGTITFDTLEKVEVMNFRKLL